MTIQIDHLHKSYGSGAEAHEVLHDINLTIDSGEVFGSLGSSGAGKSTLVRCINLLERPTSGKVRVDGEDITDAKGKELADVRNKEIGFVFQSFHLFPQYTALENVTLAGKLLAQERPDFKSRKKEIFAEIEATGQELLSRMGLAPAQVLFCGDTTIDAGTAKNAGCDFAAVLLGVTLEEDFKDWPHRFIAKDLPALDRWLRE